MVPTNHVVLSDSQSTAIELAKSKKLGCLEGQGNCEITFIRLATTGEIKRREQGLGGIIWRADE
jgi:hypothetical protein